MGFFTRIVIAAATAGLLTSGAAAQSGEVTLAAPRDFAPGPNDAYYTAVLLPVWEPLVSAGDNGEPVPRLAQSWEMSADGTEWTFTLREGIRFHDGTPLDTDAILANYDRWRQVSPKGSPFNVMHIDQSYPGLQEVRAVDDLTFTFVFDAPRPTLPYSMMNYSSPIYAPASFDAEGNFASMAFGTGPFMLVEHEPDVSLVLEANPDYWGEPAATGRITIRAIPDADTRLSALRAGEVVGLIGAGALPADRAAELLQDPRFDVSAVVSASNHHVLTNGSSSIFADVRLREAVSLAIDRQQIADLYGGYIVPTNNILNVTSPFHKSYEIPHDPERAVELAREVLGDTRVPVRLAVGTFGTSRYPYRAQAEYIQFVLQPLGFDVEIQILDTSTFFAALAQGDYELALSIQVMGNADPYSMSVDYMSSTGSSNAVLSLGYGSPEVDDLIARAAATLDLDERAALYEALQDIAVETFPTVPLFTEMNLIAFDTRVQGYEARIHDTTLSTLRLVD